VTSIASDGRGDAGIGVDELLHRQRLRESAALAYPRRLPIAIRRAYGSRVEGTDGRVYVDFLAGAGAVTLGHGHPEVVAAVERQLRSISQTLDFPTVSRDELTTEYLALLPEPMRSRTKIHYCAPTGADAVEAAIKLCRTATGRDTVVAFQGAYHGCTHETARLTSRRRADGAPGQSGSGVRHFPFSYCHRCPLGLDRLSCTTNCIEYLERSLEDSHGGLPLPAAVIVEPVQGEGGTVPATPEFMARLRALTSRYGIPLVLDEVQTGGGRTGTWFASEQYGVTPDVIVMSKGISGIGLPAAMILYDARLDVWEPGAHIGTFRGSQLGFAAGLATVRIVKRDGLLRNAAAQGDYLLSALRQATELEIVSDVRGIGLMIGIELRDDQGHDGGALAAEVQAAALRRGLIVELGGRNDSVVRLLPPLTLDEETARFAVSALLEGLVEVDEHASGHAWGNQIAAR
jgi:diaminobutyrate-2-oxoglutarate transaminase